LTLKYEAAIARIAPGPTRKANILLVPKLPTAAVDYNKKRKEFLKEMITNHTRLKFNTELLWQVIKRADAIHARIPGCENFSATFWDANSFTKLLKSICEDQLKLVVEPFDKLNGDGNIRNLYEQFPKIIKLISIGKKPKIVRACFFLLGQLIHLVEKRPDIMRQISIIAPYTTELPIELHNSAIARRVKYLELIFQNIRNESVNSSRIRDMFYQIRGVLEQKGALFEVAKSAGPAGGSSSSGL